MSSTRHIPTYKELLSAGSYLYVILKILSLKFKSVECGMQ